MMKMLVYDGVPLTFFSHSGFESLHGEAAKKLGVSLGRDAVRHLLLQKSAEAKKVLQEEIRGKMIYVKFDGVTRLRSHLMGITIQFFSSEGGIQTRTIALRDTESKNDRASVKEIVMTALRDFGITTEQVLAAVVDNAANMTRAIELMNEEEDDIDDIDNSPLQYDVSENEDEESEVVSTIEKIQDSSYEMCGSHITVGH